MILGLVVLFFIVLLIFVVYLSEVEGPAFLAGLEGLAQGGAVGVEGLAVDFWIIRVRPLLYIVVGLVFKAVGRSVGDPAMGPKAVAGMLMFATVAGILMALFLNTAGGAWDNAKKYVETGAHGGKNSEAHKAAVTGDTVGDPFKDTAGPSIHVLIKMLATITLVMAPMFLD